MKPRFPWKILTIIAALAVLAHSAGLKAPFIYDDQPTIIDNIHIRELDRFQEKVGLENFINRSVTLLSYSINLALGDLEVFGYHLLNLILHVLSSICFFFVVGELLKLEPEKKRRRWGNLPKWAGLLFSVHPLGTQTVSYLSNRSSLLATFFSILTFYVFLRFLESKRTKRHFKKTWLIISIVALFYLACASKEVSSVLPLVGMAFLMLRPFQSPRKLIPSVLIIMAPLASYLAYRAWIFGSPFKLPSGPGNYELTTLEYLLTQLHVVTFSYGMKLLWPIGLNFESGVQLVSNTSDLSWLAPVLILIVVVGILWRHPSKVVRFGFIWAVLTILPSSSIIPLKQLASEHRTYLPSIGLSIILAGTFLCLSFRWKQTGVILFVSYLMALILLSANRQLDYRSELILWRDTVKKSPNKPTLLNNLSVALMKEERFNEAEVVLEKAISMDPMYLDPYINIATILHEEGKLEEAKKRFDMIIKMNYRNKSAYYNAGVVRVDLGKNEEAVFFLQKAIGLDPDYAPYHQTLGNVYKRLGRWDKALTEYKLALKYEPKNLGAMNNRGTIFMKFNKLMLAKSEFKKVLEINPKHLEALNNLAAVYMKIGRYDKALPLMDRFLAIRPDSENVRKIRDVARYQLNLKSH